MNHSKKRFRKHILTSLFFQISFITLFMIGVYFAIEMGMGTEGQLIVSVGALFIFFISTKFFYKPKMILERFQEVYPQKKLTRNFVIFTYFFPVHFIIMIMILCFKDHSGKDEGSYFFTFRFALPTAALLVFLQISFSPIAYLTAVPSFYFITKVTDDALNIIGAGESLGQKSTPLEEYRKQINTALSSTEIILLSSYTARVLMREDKRSTASEKDDKKVMKITKAITLVDQMSEILKESESYKLRVGDYSFLQWMHPSAPGEILMLSALELLMLQKFNSVVIAKMNTIVEGLGKHINSLPESEKERMNQLLNKAVLKLRSTNSYRISYRKKSRVINDS